MTYSSPVNIQYFPHSRKKIPLSCFAIFKKLLKFLLLFMIAIFLPIEKKSPTKLILTNDFYTWETIPALFCQCLLIFVIYYFKDKAIFKKVILPKNIII